MADHSELCKYQPAPGWHQHQPRTLSPSPPPGAPNHHFHHHQLHPPHDSGPSALYGGSSYPFSPPPPLARPAPVYRGYGAASGPTTMQPHGVSFGVQMQAGTSLMHHDHHHNHHQGPVLAPLGSASPASQQSGLMYMPERHYMMYSPSHGGGSGVMGYQHSSGRGGSHNMMRPAPPTMPPQQHQLSDRHYANDHGYYMRGKRPPPASQALVDDSDSSPRRSTRHHTRAAPNHHRSLPPNVAPYVPANRSSGSPTQHLALTTAVANTGGSSSTTDLAARGSDSPAAAERECCEEGSDFQSSPSRRPSSAVANNATSPATAAGAAAAAGAKNAKTAGAKRPANSWILYRQEKHPIVLAQNEGITNNEISKVVAEWWRNEPDDVKNVYKCRAEEERRRHRILHPDYKYAPRKNKIRRKRKRKINKGLDNHESGAESADDDNRRYTTQQHSQQYQLPQQQQQLLHNQYLAQYRSLQHSNHFQSPQPHSHYGIHPPPPPPPQLLPPAPSIARATSGDRWYSRSSLDEPFFDSTAPASSSRRYSADSSSSLRYQYAELDYSLAMPSRRASEAGYYPVAADGRPNGHRMSIDRMSIGYAPVAPAPATTEYAYAPRHRPKENEFTFEALGFARCVDDTADAPGSDVDPSTDSVYAPDDGLSRAMMMQLAD
ncbi:hypothetical protein HDU90_002148 [Geranomyces variabilis]|nr:hypothetical protein HDU90_002148 [Geranomyces variabilis]